MNGIDPIQLTDLRVRYEQHEFPAERPATESDLLSVLTDEALIGELVKRGVLRKQETDVSGWWTDCWVSATAEPVGSVEGEG